MVYYRYKKQKNKNYYKLLILNIFFIFINIISVCNLFLKMFNINLHVDMA